MSEEDKVILVAEDELIMAKVEKYHPGAGIGILGALPIENHIKYHKEILEDWYKKGYIQTAYRMLGPRRRLFYVFSKIPAVFQ